MAVRLLSKDEIAKAQNSDKAREIAEGLKISRRVDSLRELMADEETKLEKFRVETLSSIKKEINDLTNEKEALQPEIEKLREEKSQGLKEVGDERHRIELLQEDVETREKILSARISEVQQREKEAETNFEESRDALIRSRSRLEEAENLHQIAFQAKENAVERIALVRKTEEESLFSRKKAEEEIGTRWFELKEREKSDELKRISVLQDLEKVGRENEKFGVREKSLDERENALSRRISELESKKTEATQNLEDSRNELERARTHNEEALRLHGLAENDRIEVRQIMEKTKDEEKALLLYKEKLEKENAEKEKNLNEREEKLSEREKENERISQELENGMIRLADRSKAREKILEKLQ